MSNIIPENTPEKQCTKCGKSFPATFEFFPKRPKNGRVYMRRHCLICERAMSCARYLAKHPKKQKEVIEDGYRRCHKCNQKLPVTEFSCDNNRADKLQVWCKSCWTQYRIDHIEQEHMWRKQYHETYREEISERRKKRYAESGRFYYQANREKRRIQTRHYRHSIQGSLVVRAQKHKRRLRMLAIECKLTTTEIQAKLKAQKYACYYCFNKFEKRKNKYIYHLDHTIPVTRTEHNPRHDVNYIVLACPHCNLTKNARLPHEWPEGGRLF